MMAASVGGPRLRVGVGMLVHYQRVQLPDNGDPWSLAGSPRNAPLHAGESQAVAVLDTHLVHFGYHQTGGLNFAKARFRIGQNFPGYADDLVFSRVNGRAGSLLELFFG